MIPPRATGWSWDKSCGRLELTMLPSTLSERLDAGLRAFAWDEWGQMGVPALPQRRSRWAQDPRRSWLRRSRSGVTIRACSTRCSAGFVNEQLLRRAGDCAPCAAVTTTSGCSPGRSAGWRSSGRARTGAATVCGHASARAGAAVPCTLRAVAPPTRRSPPSAAALGRRVQRRCRARSAHADQPGSAAAGAARRRRTRRGRPLPVDRRGAVRERHGGRPLRRLREAQRPRRARLAARCRRRLAVGGRQRAALRDRPCRVGEPAGASSRAAAAGACMAAPAGRLACAAPLAARSGAARRALRLSARKSRVRPAREHVRADFAVAGVPLGGRPGLAAWDDLEALVERLLLELSSGGE